MTELPQFFYRYRSLAGESRNRTFESITTGRHYFATPSTCNDPFDCRPSLVLGDGFQLDFEKFVRQTQNKRPYDESAAEYRLEQKQKPVHRIFNPNHGDKYDWWDREFRTIFDEEIGLFCVTTAPDSELMWSHYADSHRGICLQFDAGHKFFRDASPVRYTKIRPTIFYRGDSNDTNRIEPYLFTKSMKWKYEKEWRIAKEIKGTRRVRIPREALTAIIVGAQTTYKDKLRLLEIATTSKKKIKLCSIQLDRRRFALKVADTTWATKG